MSQVADPAINMSQVAEPDETGLRWRYQLGPKYAAMLKDFPVKRDRTR